MAFRLIAVHAHPDDESSKGAATYAYYLERGVEVLIVSCTGGERGDILNELVARDPKARRDLPGLRRDEMDRAREIVGFQHTWLGYCDSGLPDEGEPVPPLSFAAIPAERSAEALVKVVRDFKPHVMITYNEEGGYPHPDHIRCHDVSKIAWDLSGDPEAYPDAGEPWHIQKMYYEEIFNVSRMRAVYEWVSENEPDSPLREQLEQLRERLAAWEEHPRPTYQSEARVNVAEFFEKRDEALRAHSSQVPPDSSFFFWPNEMQRQVWPTEDYQLAASRVVTSGHREADLFEGIEDDS